MQARLHTRGEANLASRRGREAVGFDVLLGPTAFIISVITSPLALFYFSCIAPILVVFSLLVGVGLWFDPWQRELVGIDPQ